MEAWEQTLSVSHGPVPDSFIQHDMRRIGRGCLWLLEPAIPQVIKSPHPIRRGLTLIQEDGFNLTHFLLDRLEILYGGGTGLETLDRRSRLVNALEAFGRRAESSEPPMPPSAG